MQNAANVFDDYMDNIFDNVNTKDTSLDNSAQNQLILKTYLDFLYNGSLITQQYHLDILGQAQKFIICFIALFVLATIFILVVIGYLVFTGNVFNMKYILSIAIGGIADIFSGILIIVMKSLLVSRDSYFHQNIKSEHFSKIIGLIQTMSDGENCRNSDKHRMIEKIVDHYCNNSNDDLNSTI